MNYRGSTCQVIPRMLMEEVLGSELEGIEVGILADGRVFAQLDKRQHNYLLFPCRRHYVLHFLHYYFSRENLSRDPIIRSMMDGYHAVPVTCLVNAPRLRAIGTSTDELVSAVMYGSLELYCFVGSDGISRVRRRDGYPGDTPTMAEVPYQAMFVPSGQYYYLTAVVLAAPPIPPSHPLHNNPLFFHSNPSPRSKLSSLIPPPSPSQTCHSTSDHSSPPPLPTPSPTPAVSMTEDTTSSRGQEEESGNRKTYAEVASCPAAPKRRGSGVPASTTAPQRQQLPSGRSDQNRTLEVTASNITATQPEAAQSAESQKKKKNRRRKERQKEQLRLKAASAAGGDA